MLATLKAWRDPVFARERLGRDEPLGEIDRAKLNVNGGSLAAGHPFAATGGRIVASLAKALRRARLRPRRDPHLRRRRPGRRRDPGEVAMSDRLLAAGQLPVAGTLGQADRAAAAGRARRAGVRGRAAACCSAAPGAWPSAAARVLAELGADAATALDDPVRDARRRGRARRRGVQPAGAGRPALQGARVRRHRDRALGRARRAAAVLLSDGLRACSRPGRVIVLGGGRAARAGGLHALAGQGGRAAGATVQARPRRGGRRGPARLDAALPALAALGLRVRPGRRTSAPPASDRLGPLAGRTALVTGASRGIGAAIAEVLERDGASRRPARHPGTARTSSSTSPPPTRRR